jgi:hypothetical protein
MIQGKRDTRSFRRKSLRRLLGFTLKGHSDMGIEIGSEDLDILDYSTPYSGTYGSSGTEKGDAQ